MPHRVRLTSEAYQVRESAPAMQRGAAAPAGCVRGQPSFISRDACEAGLPSGMVCNPRYINGAWDRFHPYSRDSASCGGPLPPNLLPQLLNDASLVQASGWELLSDMSLSLMREGHVGSFTYSAGGAAPQTVQFNQAHLVQELDMPLMYVYAVPHGGGVMRLALNLTSGRATLSFPLGDGPAVIEYSISTGV
jgi:hypothetical protein